MNAAVAKKWSEYGFLSHGLRQILRRESTTISTGSANEKMSTGETYFKNTKSCTKNHLTEQIISKSYLSTTRLFSSSLIDNISSDKNILLTDKNCRKDSKIPNSRYDEVPGFLHGSFISKTNITAKSLALLDDGKSSFFLSSSIDSFNLLQKFHNTNFSRYQYNFPRLKLHNNFSKKKNFNLNPVNSVLHSTSNKLRRNIVHVPIRSPMKNSPIHFRIDDNKIRGKTEETASAEGEITPRSEEHGGAQHELPSSNPAQKALLDHVWSFHLANVILHSAVTYNYVGLLRTLHISR